MAKILIVDDDSAVQLTIRLLLERAGHSVVTASDGRNGLAQFESGDFDLLFGAAKLNLRIIDLPIRYQARTYGETNIQRWRHGWLLLRMTAFAATRLKFIK